LPHTDKTLPPLPYTLLYPSCPEGSYTHPLAQTTSSYGDLSIH
jgi:hypothetical protein